MLGAVAGELLRRTAKAHSYHARILAEPMFATPREPAYETCELHPRTGSQGMRAIPRAAIRAIAALVCVLPATPGTSDRQSARDFG